MITLRDVYINVSAAALNRQGIDGAMPAGHNGPHGDPETPIRNTAHFLIVFLRAAELSGDKLFLTAAERCLDYLLHDNPFRSDYNFHHRDKLGKDHCNGLIGPAWTIEALLYASDKLQHKGARDLARKLFLLHPFEKASGAWRRIEPDGSELKIDSTFNHQLWFAACAAPLCSDTPEATRQISHFLEMLKENWAVARNGRIIHPLWRPERRRRETFKRLLKPSYRKGRITQEIGYHAFNLYAFAMLREAGLALPPSEKTKLQRAVGYLTSNEFSSLVYDNKYAFPYNPPGWEVPYSLMVLAGETPHDCKDWIERQLAHSYNSKTGMMSRQVLDPPTQTARIYEVARLPDNFFDLPVYDSK